MDDLIGHSITYRVAVGPRACHWLAHFVARPDRDFLHSPHTITAPRHELVFILGLYNKPNDWRGMGHDQPQSP